MISIERAFNPPRSSAVLVEFVIPHVGIIQVGMNLEAFPLPLDPGADRDNPVERQGNRSLALAGR